VQHGTTALMRAVEGRHKEAASRLILAGANVSSPNDHGWGALQFATHNDMKQLLQFGG
jgi:ankyrin repeat protein